MMTNPATPPTPEQVLNANLKKRLIEEEFERQANLRNTTRQLRTLEKGAKQEKSTAYAAEKWEEVYKSGVELVKRGQQGYDNWVAAMSQILIACTEANQAISASNPLGSAVDFIYENALAIGYAKTDPKTSAEANIQLPKDFEIQYAVQFTDDNQLNIPLIENSLTRKDGKKLGAEEKQIFLTGVIAWLNVHGYGPLKDGESWQFMNKNNPQEILTKDNFDKLRDDAINGLKVFLSGAADFAFEEISEPTSTPFRMR